MKFRNRFEVSRFSEEVEKDEEQDTPLFLDLPGMRMVSLYGDLDEKKSHNIIGELLSFLEMKQVLDRQVEQLSAKEKKGLNKALVFRDPVKFLISTFGGSAVDMFGIYDVMGHVKEELEIHTIGSGKVMSAGVLLLASGTKGKRQIGKNCRVMVHSVIGGAHGPSHDIQNEVEEIMQTQKQYIDCLANETKLTVSKLNKLFSEKRNIYLSAEEAVKFGIADKIV